MVRRDLQVLVTFHDQHHLCENCVSQGFKDSPVTSFNASGCLTVTQRYSYYESEMSEWCRQEPSRATTVRCICAVVLAVMWSGILVGYYWNRENVSKMRSKILLELLAFSPEDRSERVLDLCMLPLRNCAESRAILDNDEAIQHLNRIMSAEHWKSRLDFSSLRCLTSEEHTYFKSIARHKVDGCPRSDCCNQEVKLRSRITNYNKRKAEEKIKSLSHVCGYDCSSKDPEKCQLQCQENRDRKPNRLLSLEKIKFYAENFIRGGNADY
ncbi:hypothetical protein BCON_0020g00650 [Botryotinia convoluta]|uniref:Uncharacterized protein n=1 Tax=Botryotinia convoluta TaxID=54673 RepID=A0A4Z1ISB6_9HELO|nr:hypothetical protein BCON_0020g00650 [Botryotinia convoluta]